MAISSLEDDRLTAILVLAAERPEIRQRMIKDAREGNPHGWTPELVQLLSAIETVCRTPHDWRQLRRELTERRQVRRPQNAPRPAATSTRPKGARREHQARAAKASGGQDPGDDSDPDPAEDPVERRIRELVAQAPPLSEGQRRRLVLLLGGTR